MNATQAAKRTLSQQFYLRADFPDGVVERLNQLAERLNEGATDVKSGSQSRDIANRYNAAIDAERLMRRVALDIAALTHRQQLPG